MKIRQTDIYKRILKALRKMLFCFSEQLRITNPVNAIEITAIIKIPDKESTHGASLWVDNQIQCRFSYCRMKAKKKFSKSNKHFFLINC